MDMEEDKLIRKKDKSSSYQPSLLKLNRLQWWIMVALNISFLFVGQTAAVLLGWFYFGQGGKSKWMATLVQTAAFPILIVPYFFVSSSEKDAYSSNQPPGLLISFIYIAIGAMVAADNMLYSIGLLYLSASTYSLLCASQLAFNAIFSFFINKQKFTILIFNSVVILTLSASLLGINEDSDSPSGISSSKYSIGIITTVAASALYSLILSITQLTFDTILKNEKISSVFKMQIYISITATFVSIIGLFSSGEWNTLQNEMNTFASGKVFYVMTLVWTSISWQVCAVGIVGLIYLVSSLFSNVISTISLAVTPLASMLLFHDSANGVKIIAMLMAFWGFISYFYQNYLDNLWIRRSRLQGNDLRNDELV